MSKPPEADPTRTRFDFLSSFGRRMGRRLHPPARKLVDEYLPQWCITLPDAPSVWHIPSGYESVHLEIGFGAGEHLLARAVSQPDCLFIGCEPYINGVAKLLGDMQRHDIRNVRLFTDDARLLLPRLPEASIAQVYLLFPDPWPKLRYHKRRIVNHQTLDMLARIQPVGASLLIATDHPDYAQWIIAQISKHPAYHLTNPSIEEQWQEPQGWVKTRYQQKTFAEGRPARFFYAKRCE